ncbi:hypothetical protein LTR91_001561 [Friedmanniomyces endolithicus]|uniref:Uncharacterized protein n=1 Tax=Friedmanniomyces endolithicus TaxID=329885 RepID=A0A4U0UPV7_9PEZI|nr:hypothetical protein LTS09_008007 [Friedmanniomyces endolithicus]KAK0268033.1 hypothetical protein LTR35_015834 [Friedmanniomyces endolithicus]KAK0275766.1 hypothetical protein LTS00_014913 [Friedmanniomyces endolithicus]KAK0316610.1 hypothetical protein LTR01_000359 [Friedmanniomyces endolithicus]KAK0327818.1 hypothetical protein LTR82_001335 [Friedmanniomyces endolithicus]
MADTDVTDDETPNQRQARLRREKRNKKMATEGEDRLARIKALNGGVAPPDAVLGGPAAPTTANQATVHDDPEEADIDDIRGMQKPGSQGPADPLAAMFQMQQQQQQGGSGEDPMMRMMQQVTAMMGGNPENPNDPNQQPQIPAALQALMGGMGAGNNAEAQKAPETGSAYLWRIVHAVFAATLAIYITLSSTFNGSKLARSESVYTQEAGYGFGQTLFIMFTSAELVLQSSRYFMEKGQLQGSGILAKVANSGFVPEPYAQYVRTAGRYVGIAQTIFSDAMVVIFVFGLLAWWKGLATA